MTLLYLDTSALFKRYVEEDETDAVLAQLDAATEHGTALITRVEVTAALAKAVRDERMDPMEARDAEQDFLADWTNFTRVGLTEDLASRAGELAWTYGLRGYDAVQLAAALAWRAATEETEDEIVFACFDDKLTEAARVEALETWPE